jgi:ABC-type multidrug transport system fused ATPase/permease subunit
MRFTRTVKRSLALLDRKDRIKTISFVIFQLFVSLLDLGGVILFSATAYFGAQNFIGTPPTKTSSKLTHVFDVFQSYFPNLESLITFLFITSVLFFVSKNLISLLLVSIMIKRMNAITATFSSKLAGKLFRLDLAFLQKRSSQLTASAISYSASYAIVDVLNAAMVLVSELTLLLLFSIMLVYFHPFITLVAIIYFALIVYFIQFRILRLSAEYGENRNKFDISSIETTQEIMTLFREIKVSNRLNYFVQNFSNQRLNSAKANIGGQSAAQVPKFLLETALITGAVILGVSQFITNDSQSAITTLALFLTVGIRILPSLLRIQSCITIIQVSGGAASVTYDLVDDVNATFYIKNDIEKFPNYHGDISRQFTPSVELVGVSFQYPEESKFAIRNLSFSVKEGETLAIVGPSGAGKSTLTDLILGVNRVSVGEIRISGVPADLATKLWPGVIAYVPQITSLMNCTIRENVAIGLPAHEINDQDVWSALRFAQLFEFITNLPDKLDTNIGENGHRLSGGQRQRLGIARALYTKPRLLILDEATSAMDAETEESVTHAIQNLAGEITLIIIAHRLSTVRKADSILYLQEGKAVAIAKFEELRNKVPNFDKQAGLLGL